MRATVDDDHVLQAVLESLPGDAAVLDGERTIRAANAGFRSRFATEPIGRRCHEVLHNRWEPCEAPDVACPFAICVAAPGGAPVPGSHHHLAEDGWRREHVLMRPIVAADGRVTACLARFSPARRERAGRLPSLRALAREIRPLQPQLKRLALGQRPILLVGEPGARLPRVALAAHRLSRRRGPFEERSACELSGGRLADWLRAPPPQGSGTLFLQDVQELDEPGRRGLAAWLGEGAPAGRRQWRLVAGSDRQPEDLLVAGEGAVVLARGRLRVPPLRERPADLADLATQLLVGISARPMRLSREAEARLRVYPFPGNLDELEQALRHAAVLANGPVVHVEDLPAWVCAQA